MVSPAIKLTPTPFKNNPTAQHPTIGKWNVYINGELRFQAYLSDVDRWWLCSFREERIFSGSRLGTRVWNYQVKNGESMKEYIIKEFAIHGFKPEAVYA